MTPRFFVLFLALLLACAPLSSTVAFVIPTAKNAVCISLTTRQPFSTTRTGTGTTSFLLLAAKPKGRQKQPQPQGLISSSRRKQLGISDDEDEYDLDVALDTNTDPLITKIIAGSLILAILGLLVVGVVVPSITDYGEGVCSPIQNGGRC